MTICGDDDNVQGNYKPDPTMINIIQQECGNSARFIMVGDRDSDIAAAKNSDRKAFTKTISIQNKPNVIADYTIPNARLITPQLVDEIFQ